MKEVRDYWISYTPMYVGPSDPPQWMLTASMLRSPMIITDIQPNVLHIDSSNGLDKACLLHCRLGYVNKKRIAQL